MLTKKPVIRDQFSRNPPVKGEVNKKPSLTIPDMTMTVREIMIRYANGLPVYGEKVPIYNGEEGFMPDLRKMDLTEIAKYRDDLSKRLQDQFKEKEQGPAESASGQVQQTSDSQVQQQSGVVQTTSQTSS